VVDWIHLAGYPATVNIADVAIRLGAVCAVISVLGSRQRDVSHDRRDRDTPAAWRE
jgi:lipoprotein signal peptidase